MSPLCQSNGILGAFIQCADTVHFVPYSGDVFMYRLYMTPPVTNKQLQLLINNVQCEYDVGL